MTDQTKARMFVSTGRLHTETEWFRSFSTLSTQNDAFGPLYLLKDDTLAGQQSLKFSVSEDSLILLLPTIGTIVYQDSLKNQELIEASQMQLYSLPGGSELVISNPYEKQAVNYIQIWMKKPFTARHHFCRSSFDINKNINRLVDLRPSEFMGQCLKAIRIGKFTGREKATYKLRKPGNGVFLFVLEGAFEVQHRLMKRGDALALWNTDEIELEALSNNAIICMLELEL